MRFAGKIGFVQTVQDKDDDTIWSLQTTEKTVYGDVLRDTRGNEKSSYLNDNFTITNQFSIVADDYAYHNLQYIKYIIYLGVKWRVTSVDALRRPRLVLSVNGVYNDPADQTYSGVDNDGDEN